jgi:hypothetical protein
MQHHVHFKDSFLSRDDDAPLLQEVCWTQSRGMESRLRGGHRQPEGQVLQVAGMYGALTKVIRAAVHIPRTFHCNGTVTSWLCLQVPMISLSTGFALSKIQVNASGLQCLPRYLDAAARRSFRQDCCKRARHLRPGSKSPLSKNNG